jgi:hypothetical protein
MARRQAYDINAEWVDPFEKRRNEERRSTSRFLAHLKVQIAVDMPEIQRRLVGPGVVRDLSEGGLQIVTKHRLTPSQRVTVVIPTQDTPQSPVLRQSFQGKAQVVRVNERGNDRCAVVALRFGDAFTDDMEFALFVDHLRALAFAQQQRRSA